MTELRTRMVRDMTLRAHALLALSLFLDSRHRRRGPRIPHPSAIAAAPPRASALPPDP